MAKKPKKSKRKVPTESIAMEIDPSTGEDRRAEAVTVAWMLCMLATTAADVLSGLMFVLLPLLFAQSSDDTEMSPLVFPRLLLLVGALTGAACVTLTPLVYRFRRNPPPAAVTAFGLVISIAPVVGLFWMAIER